MRVTRHDKRKPKPMQLPTTLDIPQPREGESPAAYDRRLSAFVRGDDVRSKVDLREWTGSMPFHLNKEKSQCPK